MPAMGVEETRAQIEKGWPEALMVSPEELASLRAHDRLAALVHCTTVALFVPLTVLAVVVAVLCLVTPPSRPPAAVRSRAAIRDYSALTQLHEQRLQGP